MAGHLKQLKPWNGRFSARVVVPGRLRPCLDGKAELDIRHGGDWRNALCARPTLPAIAETTLAKVTSFHRDGVALHPVRLTV